MTHGRARRDGEPPGRPHPEPEQLETLALGGAGEAEPALRRHVAGCAACAEEVEALRGLHAALLRLPALAPAAGFAARVMARVSLPVPWHARAWAFARRRWLPVVSAAGALGASTGGVLAWLARHPGLTLVDLWAFGLERLRGAFWGGTVAVWQAVLESGALAAALRVGGGLTLEDAILGLATLSLVGMGAVAGLVRLLRETEGGLTPVARG